MPYFQSQEKQLYQKYVSMQIQYILRRTGMRRRFNEIRCCLLLISSRKISSGFVLAIAEELMKQQSHSEPSRLIKGTFPGLCTYNNRQICRCVSLYCWKEERLILAMYLVQQGDKEQQAYCHNRRQMCQNAQKEKRLLKYFTIIY